MDNAQIELVSALLTTFKDGNIPAFLFVGIIPATTNKKAKKEKKS